MLNMGNIPKYDKRERLIQLVCTIASTRLMREFFEFLKKLPSEIGKEELEIYYLILKTEKIFYSDTEIYKYLYHKVTSEIDTERPRYIRSKDKKHFIGKDKSLNIMKKAGLLRTGDILPNSKRTWKYQAKIEPVIWAWEYEAQNIFESINVEKGQVLLSQWSKEDLLQGLESYIYKIEPQIDIERKIRNSLKGLSEQEQLNKLIEGLNTEFVLQDLPTIDTLHYLIHKDFNQSRATLDSLSYEKQARLIQNAKRKQNKK